MFVSQGTLKYYCNSSMLCMHTVSKDSIISTFTGLDDLEGQLTAAVNSLNDISLALEQLDMLSSSINASLNNLTQAAAAASTGVVVPTGDSLVTLVGNLTAVSCVSIFSIWSHSL